MTFESKKDTWLGLLVWGILGGSLIMTVIQSAWIGTLILGIACFVAAKIWFGTRYTFITDELVVGCGLITWRIPLNEIKTVKKVRSIISSAALSMDRLEISYGKYEKVWISPKEEMEFLHYLKNHSPQVKIIDAVHK